MKKAIYFILLLTINLCFSQTDTLPAQLLKEVVVTAYKTEQKVNEVGRSITVIDQAEIQRSTHRNVAELLSEKEGIYTVGTEQVPGAVQSLFLRGANPEHTAVFIDGIRMTDPSTPTNALDLTEISLVNVDRIEIIRGSHSTLYGTSAIGGVIHILTKKDLDKGLKGNISLYTGTFGSSSFELSENILLNYATQHGIYLQTEMYHTQVNGLSATVNQDGNPTPESDNFNKLDWIGKLGFKNNKWDIHINYKNIIQQADIDDGAYIDDNNHIANFSRNLYAYQLAYKPINNLSIKFTGGYSDSKRSFTDIDMANMNTSDSTTIIKNNASEGKYKSALRNNDVLFDYQLKHFSVLFGMGHYRENMNSESSFRTHETFLINNEIDSNSQGSFDPVFPHAFTNIYTAYAKGDLKGSLLGNVFKRFNLVLGTRYNYHNTFKHNWTYEISPSYQIGRKSLIYASYSTGFNAPSLFRLFDSSYGNMNLMPEKSISYEIGLKQQIGKSNAFTVSFFQTEVDDLIDFLSLHDYDKIDSIVGFTYLNLGKQINRGVEMNIQSKLNEKINIQANLSLLQGKLIYKPENSSYTEDYHLGIMSQILTRKIEINKLIRRSNTFNVNIAYQLSKKLAIMLNTRHVGARKDIYPDKLRNYTLAGLTANYAISNHFFATFSIKNLLNTKYQEIYGYSTRRRGFYFKLNYNFGIKKK